MASMTTTANTFASKATTAHQARLAYVYVRQSSLVQTIRHGESTELQYHLVERAVQLGWPRDRVKVIDEDLGKSGASAVDRSGFQYLIAEVGLGRVGLVVSMDASRLARNNSDWYQLLELCSIFGTLIADGESLYDPRLYADRMLLGLSGMMSEAELHHLKRRLHAGALNKAERGELRLPLPVGLERLKDGTVILHPDEEVQARLRLVFRKFKELEAAKAIVRYLQQEDLLLPSRPLQGPAPHEVVWRKAGSSAVLEILKNPAYAGTYVYGRQRRDPTRQQPGHPASGIVQVPIDKWPIVLHNVYPAYISWNEFLANQSQLQANQSRYQEDRHGVPRKGQALLQGILICGLCGQRMRLRYSGPKGEFPVYVCDYARSQYNEPRCQEVRGLGLDAEVERLVLEALAPDRIQLALATLEELEQEYATLRQQWELRLERARYEAKRARRQYNAVEPENRLVARTLEKQWEEKLRAVEHVEQEYQTWRRQHRLELTAADRQDILSLGQDLPKLWHATGTTPADHKRIVRLIIKEVIVDQRRWHGQVWVQINWQTGAVTEHKYKRRVLSYDAHADLETLEQRLRELHAEQKMDQEIAAMLNEEGFRTTKGQAFNIKTVWLLRQRWSLPAVKPNGPYPARWEDGTYSVEGAAAVLGVHTSTIYKWLRQGQLKGDQPGKGLPWKIPLTENEIAAWRERVARNRQPQKQGSG
jgi:excisionase family DNA binding protein